METIKSGNIIILLQLLCPVAKLIHGYDVEPNLAYDGYEAMPADMREKVPTIRAFAALFKEIIHETVAVFNLRDNCCLDRRGRCTKCDKKVAAVLAEVYIVIAEYASKVGAPLYFVSMAGKSSKVGKYMVPILEKRPELFNCIFCGYHLSLCSYHNPWAFNGSYRNQIEKVSANVKDLLSELGKPEAYQMALDDARLTSVRDLSVLSAEELTNLFEPKKQTRFTQ